MACHNGHYTIVYQFLVYSAEGIVPLRTGKIIDTHKQMLIVLFRPISGKMLAAGSEAFFLCAAHKGLCITYGILRAVIEGPCLHNGISPVKKQIHNRGKIPVAAHGGGFGSAYTGHFIGQLLRIRCGDRSSVGNRGPALNSAISSGFTVGGY